MLFKFPFQNVKPSFSGSSTVSDTSLDVVLKQSLCPHIACLGGKHKRHNDKTSGSEKCN